MNWLVIAAVVLESLIYQPPCTPTQASPPITAASVESYGAVGDGVADDTVAINTALLAGSAVLTPGKTYKTTDLIRLTIPNEILWGYGATVYSYIATQTPRLSIRLQAAGQELRGVALTTNLRARLSGNQDRCGIQLNSANQKVIDNRVEYANCGIMAIGATDFQILNNVVYRTQADGITVTSNSQRGTVRCNLVRENGDDQISIVGYNVGDPQIGNFLIADNDVAWSYKGHGIAVYGAYNVSIQNNVVANEWGYAGIYVATDWNYQTSNTNRINVRANTVTNIQSVIPTYDPIGASVGLHRTGQGSISAYSTTGYLTSDVTIESNVITGSGYSDVKLSGTACGVTLMQTGTLLNQMAAGCLH